MKGRGAEIEGRCRGEMKRRDEERKEWRRGRVEKREGRKEKVWSKEGRKVRGKDGS